ncbi:MAG TPA: type II CAAX endopeptidase family protein [Verrucomicrobiae bacterium]|nr:type II CAAX endopeptidase family protein [Verrucomicrobiae bacterium]
MPFSLAAAIWAAVVVMAAFYGMALGYSGWRFTLGLGVAAGLFAFEFFLAAPAVLSRAFQTPGRLGVALLVLVPLIFGLVYLLAIAENWKLALVAAVYAVLPVSLAAMSEGKPAGTWGDYISILIIWLPVEFRWMYRLFVFPARQGMAIWPLTHTLTILFALGTAVAAFVLVRRMDGIGYAVKWKRGYTLTIASHFGLFALIAIPLGLRLGFLHYDPSVLRLKSLPLAAIGILFFTAWPEEFLFRGLLQNALSGTTRNRWAGLAIAAVIFGLSHILHAPFPNWKYVALATIAGLFYGHAWMKSDSLVPSAIVHALVDISWHVLFR